MSLTITNERLASPTEWDSTFKECDYATYYHSREWAELWQKYTQGKLTPAAKLVTFSDGNSAIITLSSQRILKRVFKQYLSSPAGTYGGWISISKLSNNHKQLLYSYIVNKCKNLIWRLNPYDPVDDIENSKNIEPDETYTLNLECGFDVIYKGWTKGHASAARKARKARKAGVEIKEATTLQDWKEYYEIYEDSLRRWGDSASSRYGWTLFQLIYNLSSSNIRLWLSVFDGKVVAGALCLYARKHVGYWHGAASSEYFKLRPVNLLMYEIIKNSCEEGYRWFDFNPSGGHEGVRNFKKSFGAMELYCPVVKIESKVTVFLNQAIRLLHDTLK